MIDENDLKVLPLEGFPRQMAALSNCLVLLEQEYIQSGKILVKYSEGDRVQDAKSVTLGPGDNFHVYRGLRHQMIAIEDTELFEFSTQHFDEDSHRILKGD